MKDWLFVTGASVLVIVGTLILIVGRILNVTQLRLDEIPTPPAVVKTGSFTDNSPPIMGDILVRDSHGNQIVRATNGEKYFINNKGVSFRLQD